MGYTAPEECSTQIRQDLVPSLSSMHASQRAVYIRAQILSKVPPAERQRKFEQFRECFVKFDAGDVWEKYIEPVREVILS